MKQVSSTFRAFWMRVRFLFSRRTRAETDEELQFHIERQTEANLAAGMTPEEARRRAVIAFGGVEHAREACSEARPGWFLDTLWQDVRYALRGFRRTPVFTITVVAMLTLGIGATTAVFSVVDRILFRSLPYTHDDRIVSVGLVHSLERQEFMLGGFFFDWRDHQKPFEAFASQGTYPHACDLIETNPAQLGCLNIQAGFLPLLGISPVLGRNFLPEEDRSNGPPVALISYGVWRSHYNQDPGILNRLIDIDGASVRVVGVLPKDFELPTLQSADVLRPMGLDEMQERTAMPGSPMRTFARLKPDVSIAQARAELQPLFRHTQTLVPAEIRNDFHLSVRSLRDRETQDVQLMAWILLGSVLAVLLIACANLASLMMARGAARERELTSQLLELPRLVEQTLKLDGRIRVLAEIFADKRHALFLGRGSLYAIALEGALKLKEISYIHAEGYAAAELKHGPLALVDEDMPVVAVAPNNELLEKLKSNLQEVRARGGQLFVFADPKAGMKSEEGVTVVDMPAAASELQAPIVFAVPMQLLAYHVAVLKGTDVDQPRNLAKSLTVE